MLRLNISLLVITSAMPRITVENAKSCATPSLLVTKHRTSSSKEKAISQQMFRPSTNTIRTTGHSLEHLTTLIPLPLRNFTSLTSRIWSPKLRPSSYKGRQQVSRGLPAYSKRWTILVIDNSMLKISDGVSLTTGSISQRKRLNSC